MQVDNQTLQYVMMILGISLGTNVYFFTIKPFSKLMRWIEKPKTEKVE